MTEKGKTPRATILIVDDTPANISVLMAFLEKNEFDVMVAEDGAMALQTVQYSNPDLILLDIMMPNMDGYEACEKLKKDPKTMNIPIIFMTALSDTGEKVKGLELGAVDFITKPFKNEEVLARIRTHISLIQTQQELLDKELELRTMAAMEESRKDFLELITGELKTPLMSIYGNSRLLLDSKLDKDQEESLSSIMEACSKLEKFTTGILDFLKESSNLNRNRQNRIQLEPMVRFIANSLKVDADAKRLHLVTEFDPRTPDSLRGNPVIYRRILTELLRNAIQFSNAGKIIIKVTCNGMNENKGNNNSGNLWKISFSIKDQGIGIPENKKQLIFSPFYQINPNKENSGIGLGLSLVKKLCRMIGAEIKLNSIEGEGTEVILNTEIPE
jgi:signal transduction histidine kinase